MKYYLVSPLSLRMNSISTVLTSFAVSINDATANMGLRFVPCGIKLAVTDMAFANRFAETLGRCFETKVWRKSYTRTRKANPKIGMPETPVTEHIVIISSREWYDRMSPVKHGRNFDLICSKTLEFRKGFLQGMLDSEGYVNHTNGYTDIAGKDLVLLETAAEIAREMGYKARVYGPYPYARGVAHLRINDCLDKTVEK